VLREFAKADKPKPAGTFALTRHADKLAGRAVWLCIGNQDERVDTDEAIVLTRKIVKAAVAENKPVRVELHVMPTVGHRIRATPHDEAAAWFAAWLKDQARQHVAPKVCWNNGLDHQLLQPGFKASLHRLPLPDDSFLRKEFVQKVVTSEQYGTQQS
jgi:hypothetical protein